jgi:glycosyltransferase involved in cell wall biosynthesis
MKVEEPVSTEKLPITVVTMTYNEKLTLQACFSSVTDYVDEIVIVDSFSNDKTLEIAR